MTAIHTESRPRILLLSFSPLARDPRVLRQASFLRDDYEVTAAGFGDAGGHYPGFVEIAPAQGSLPFKALQAARLKLGLFERYYRAQPHVRDAWRTLRGQDFDLILANDLAALPLSLRLARQNGAKVLLDAHEYEPRHYVGNFLFDFFFRPLWDHVARHHLGMIHGMSTACAGIADLYSQEYGIRPEVITNAPFHDPAPPSPVGDTAIRMVHHGICNRFRGIETMIELMGRLDERFSLDLFLVDAGHGYFKHISELIKATPRVALRPPVPFTDIIPTLNGYDVGLCMFQPSTPTMRHALPNKFFEFIQAKLCVCTWPSPEMANIVAETGCGIVSEAFEIESLAARLRALTPATLAQYKQKTQMAAKKYCAENNRKTLLDLVRRALTRQGTAR